MSAVGTQPVQGHDRKQTISTTQQSETDREVIAQQRRLLRVALLVLIGITALCSFCYFYGLFAHSPEIFIGATCMTVTIFFYGEVVCSMCANVYRRPQILLVALLKIVLIILIVRSDLLKNPSSMLWSVGGFLLALILTAFLVGGGERTTADASS
jgi:hypothetical protein